MKSISIKIKYLIFLVIFIAMSYLSLIAVYHIASDKSSFLSLGIFSKELFVQIAILLPIYFIADTLRFYYTLKAINVNVPFKFIISLAFINIFVSNITPAATGGGFAQIYFLNKARVPIGAATAGSSIRTALPLIFFMVLAPIILIFDRNIERLFPNRNVLVYMGVVLVLAAFGIIFIYKLIKKPESIILTIQKLISFFNRKESANNRTSKKLDKLAVEIKGFSEHLQMYLHGNRKYVFLSIGFTLLFLFTLFLFPVLLIRDLNPSASAIEIFLHKS
ncbi:flippase-like domain-containing protein [Clostridiales bacterium BAD-6]|uniref:Phosphatidylglycerol lysyltransferase n=2 Tax=Sinanaerobacter chloroacetimidivorans TaxID=2818044 RepID=A0A8J7W0D4_9FIRM|nr:flippase-like domain-containing protein [Sinanaerobacter chloroacetimidivorans]